MNLTRRTLLTAVATLGVCTLAAVDSQDARPQRRQLDWHELHTHIATGDLVYRRGLDVVSRLSQLGDGLAGDFSHLGVAFKDAGGRVHVWHAAPPEGPYRGGLVLDPLELFWSPAHAQRLAWQATGASLPNLAAGVAFARAVMGTPFDEAFDRHDASALYCTEFAHQFLAHAGLNLSVRESQYPLLVGTLSVLTVGELLRVVQTQGAPLIPVS